MVYGNMGTMLLYNKDMNLYSTNTNVYMSSKKLHQLSTTKVNMQFMLLLYQNPLYYN
jgi:hypothetical protein